MPNKDYKKLLSPNTQYGQSHQSQNQHKRERSKNNWDKDQQHQVFQSVQKYLGIGIDRLIKSLLFVLSVLFFWVIPLQPFLNSKFQIFQKWLSIRQNSIYLVCTILTVVIITNLVNLQVLGNGQFFEANSKTNQPIIYDIIAAKRGNIFMRDLAQNRNDIPLTTNQIRYNITIDPTTLKAQKYTNLDEVAEVVSARTNISLSQIIQRFNQEVSRNIPSRYAILQKEVSEDQKIAVESLKQDRVSDRKYGFSLWLGIEEANVRTYPEGKLLAQTIGYTPKFPMPTDDAKRRQGCKSMVEQNQTRSTVLASGYQVGDRGIEELYCSILGGVNGRKINNAELTNPDKVRQNTVIDGANVHLTIDRNLQKKAENILEEAVKANTNGNGSPRDGCVMVMEASTGKILAMASNPSFDPNFYSEYYKNNPNSFRNSCTSNDYEVGSVMKPLTVAVGLQVSQNYTDDNRYVGFNSNYTFEDWDKKGKPYKDGTNTIYIKNASGNSWKDFGKIGAKEILRDSINTGIADMVDKIGNKNLRQFFLDKIEFGSNAGMLNLPGDTNGNVSSFFGEKDCVYCYAAKGFGQGFSISALQLAKSYTALTNSGTMINPTIIDKIKCSNFQNNCVPDDLKPDNKPIQVFTKQVADKVVDYMVATADEGFKNAGPTKASVNGYKIALKSGTAQVSRPIITPEGKTIACSQDCNTQRGIYDHTLIGYNAGTSSRYIVLIKLAQPRPGEISNFATTTLSPFFGEMMKYTLEYLNIPKDR